MFKNYFKTALRNIARHRTFSFINIAGLSIGIAICYIILLYVHSELSYDRYNTNVDRIERIVFKADINGGKISESIVMPPVAAAMKADYPEVEDATRLRNLGTPKISYDHKVFESDRVALVDPNFFKIFTLPLIKGDPRTALDQPNSIVISKAVAIKYFGNLDPIGKTLALYDNNNLFRVTGLIDSVPENSHFHFDLFGSLIGMKDAASDSWMQSNYFTYLLLRKGADARELQAKLPGMVEKYMGPQIQKEMGLSLEQFRTRGNNLGFVLQPLTSIHLHSDTSTELEPGGNAQNVYIFGAIAIFMLLIACINFINLSTAGAAKRAKEVGVRKVIGSTRTELIRQFLFESALLVFIALSISGLLVMLTLPYFNALSGKTLTFGFNGKIIGSFAGLGLLVSIFAGMYPAFFLSSFKPINVLKGKIKGTHSGFGLRSVLVIFQFFISVGLIIATLVVWQQMEYIQHKNLGYDKDQLLEIANSGILGKNEQVFKTSFLRDPRIVNATVSSYKPTGPTNKNNALTYPEGHDDQILSAVDYRVDEAYVPTFGMQLATGRNFSDKFATDSTAMILNEAAVQAFGWNNTTAIGKNLIWENADRGTNIPYHIIGVVKNFNFKSLHQPISPLLMTLKPESGLVFRIKTTDVRGLLAAMKQQWDQYNTGEPFTYYFLNDLYNKTYASEEKTGTILNLFALLTIVVACLGLFGLVTYTAERRTKEIGIRKVLGARVFQVTELLSKEFIRLVFISCLLAFPISYWAMNKWLEGFAYRISIRWWIFVVAGILALFITVFTVSFQAIKAAIANPVKSLRNE